MGLKYKVEEMFYYTSPAPQIVTRCFANIAINSIVDLDILGANIRNSGMEIDPLADGVLRVFVNNLEKIKHNAAAGIKLQFHST